MKLFEVYDYAARHSYGWRASLPTAVNCLLKARAKVEPSVTEETILVCGNPRVIRVESTPHTILIYDVLGRCLQEEGHPLHDRLSALYNFNPRSREPASHQIPTGWYTLYLYPMLEKHSQHYTAATAARESARYVCHLNGSRRRRLRCYDPMGNPVDFEHPEYAEYAKAFTEQFQKSRRI